ncbi:lasso peptide biosynthesis B2 protein [Tateyamaria pelophila]|uniref:lasso peptide biosynthesis B2 protein n=1 Tax=Tateyamaria pelophila TaxID=328415 RepID=UPI001CBEC5AD
MLSKLRQLNWQQWSDLCVAVITLGRARLKLPHFKAAELQELQNAQGQTSRSAPPAQQVATRIARVTWAIPRAAKFVPWRSDCLVQAQAGQNWLKRYSIKSKIELGARKSSNGQMDAHAWLICDGEIVTGGDITTFVPFR